MRNCSPLLVVSIKVKNIVLFLPLGSPEVSAPDLENSLKEKLQRSSIVFTDLKKENKYK